MWTNEKLEKLKELYPNTDNNKISEILNIKRGYIIKKANDIGLYKNETYVSNMRKKNNPFPPTCWSEIDTDKLIVLYKTTSDNEIAKTLNKTKKSIGKKLKILKINRTKEEKNYITSKKCKENGRDLSEDFVKNIALKYNTKGEFYLYDSSAYKKALDYGWLDNICRHMVLKNISLPQLILKDLLEYMLNDKCVYNDRQVIKPLEIDCYFPKWKIGWEYDGKYYHNEVKDNKKKRICKMNGIILLNIHEHTKDFRKYEVNIKNQLIKQINFIEKIVGFKISTDKILNHKPNLVFPNLLTIFEKNLVVNKKMSEIKIINDVLFKRIKKYKIYEDITLNINNDLKKNKTFKTFDEYQKHLIDSEYKTFSELCEHEHPHRLLKKWKLPINLIHRLFNEEKQKTAFN
jgi:hypothetical protein